MSLDDQSESIPGTETAEPQALETQEAPREAANEVASEQEFGELREAVVADIETRAQAATAQGAEQVEKVAGTYDLPAEAVVQVRQESGVDARIAENAEEIQALAETTRAEIVDVSAQELPVDTTVADNAQQIQNLAEETKGQLDQTSLNSKQGLLKQFTKETAQPERDQLAQELREERRTIQGMKAVAEMKREGIQEDTARKESIVSEREQSIERTTGELNELRNRLEKMNDGSLNKIRNYLQSRATRSEIRQKEVSLQAHEAMGSVEESMAEQARTVLAQLESEKLPKEYEKANELLRDFYAKQAKKWESKAYTKEDLDKYFNEDYLASASEEEYGLLLRRFPGTVSYVIRQGVRDHGMLAAHQKGMGEFSDGFKNLSEEGRLKSPLSLSLASHEKAGTVGDYLLGDAKDFESALRKLNKWMTDDWASFNDFSAIHFAANEVADDYYGAESGNEMFLVYPSALVASQFRVKGDLKKDSGGDANDQWVWTKDEEGIDVDAGLTFIPAGTRVDSSTGSKYALDENKVPILDGEKFKLAEQTIPAREYWEQYFKANPGQRPSKVIYYSESSPTSALNAWKKKHLASRKEPHSYTPEPRKPRSYTPEAEVTLRLPKNETLPGYQRVMGLALESLFDRFGEGEVYDELADEEFPKNLADFFVNELLPTIKVEQKSQENLRDEAKS